MKILVVDDSSTMRRIIINCLKQVGIDQIEEAADGVEAEIKLKHESIQLILSDWNMPNRNGLELLKLCKSDPEFKDIPFIMVTTEAEKKRVVTAIQAGAANYVVKPFTPETIKDKLGKFLTMD